MARFTVYSPDDIVKQLARAGKLDEIAPKMLEAAAPALVGTTKRNLKTSIDEGTGELVDSVKATKSKKKKDGGYYIQVAPTGTDKKGVRNIEKGAYKEYGTSKQTARPWIQKSLNDAEPSVVNKMQEVYNREVGD